MKFLFFTVIFSALVASCATSSPPNREPADVSIERMPQEKIAQKQVSGRKNGPIMLSHGENLAWQKFFTTPPDPRQKSELEKALKAYDGKKTTEALLKRGRTMVSLGRLKEAEAVFQEGLRLDPRHLPLILDLAQVFLRQHKTQEAMGFLGQAHGVLSQLENPPKDEAFRYKYVLALAHLQRGERDKGQSMLSDLIAIEKGFTPGYAALAGSYLAMGRFKVAEFIAKRGIDRGKDDPGLLNILGVVENQRGNEARARQYFDDALEKNPNFVPALVNRASSNIKRMEYMPAELDLEKSISIEPENVEALIALGVVQKKMGRMKAAKTSFERAIDANPESGVARYNLANLYMDELGDSGEALRLYHEVTQVRDVDAKTRQMAIQRIEGLQGRSLSR